MRQTSKQNSNHFQKSRFWRTKRCGRLGSLMKSHANNLERSQLLNSLCKMIRQKVDFFKLQVAATRARLISKSCGILKCKSVSSGGNLVGWFICSFYSFGSLNKHWKQVSTTVRLLLHKRIQVYIQSIIFTSFR